MQVLIKATLIITLATKSHDPLSDVNLTSERQEFFYQNGFTSIRDIDSSGCLLKQISLREPNSDSSRSLFFQPKSAAKGYSGN